MSDVSLEQVNGEGAVFIVENGKMVEKRYSSEAFARTFASGQRLRMGLKPSEQALFLLESHQGGELEVQPIYEAARALIEEQLREP